MRLQDALSQCMETQWKGTPGETTAQINAQAAIDFFGGTSSLKSITTKRLDKYVLHLSDKGNAPATINRKLAALSKILTYSVHRGELSKLPHMPYQKEPQGRLRWLTSDEEKALLTFFRDRQMWDHANAVEVLIDTGLRPSELWRVKASHLTGNALLVPTSKNGHPRCVPLTQRVTHILQRLSVKHGAEELFPHDNPWMEYGWGLAKHALGFTADREFLVYALRHTCASRLLQRNIPLHVVSQWMGHRDMKTTMRYAHLSLKNLEQARDVLEGGL